MLCSYEYRMYPNDSQKELLAKHFGHCRWFYNYALNKRIETYKAINKTISRYEPSSKLCSSCGYIKHDLNINDGTWICPKCNVNHDRDLNASINIKAIALKNYNKNNTGLIRNTQKSKPVMEPKGTKTGRLIVRSIEAQKSLASG